VPAGRNVNTRHTIKKTSVPSVLVAVAPSRMLSKRIVDAKAKTGVKMPNVRQRAQTIIKIALRDDGEDRFPALIQKTTSAI
jgi:hypothetical protein